MVELVNGDGWGGGELGACLPCCSQGICLFECVCVGLDAHAVMGAYFEKPLARGILWGWLVGDPWTA